MPTVVLLISEYRERKIKHFGGLCARSFKPCLLRVYFVAKIYNYWGFILRMRSEFEEGITCVHDVEGKLH